MPHIGLCRLRDFKPEVTSTSPFRQTERALVSKYSQALKHVNRESTSVRVQVNRGLPVALNPGGTGVSIVSLMMNRYQPLRYCCAEATVYNKLIKKSVDH